MEENRGAAFKEPLFTKPAGNAFFWRVARSHPTPPGCSERPSESSAPRSLITQHGCFHPPVCLRLFGVWLDNKERFFFFLGVFFSSSID